MDRVDYQSIIVQDLWNDYTDEKLNLNPWYQRRSVWLQPQRSYLINTLLERKPIPALYIRHTIDLERQKSVKEVVDGQQRCRSIIDFCENRLSAKINTPGEKKFFQDLKDSEREKFLLTPIPVGFLLGADDKDVIDIFGRMNSISKTLNTQERRNAKFSGDFKQFCLKFAASKINFWRTCNIFTATQISRMDEVQFISDIVYNMMFGLSDFRPKDLDAVYKDNDSSFDKETEINDRLEKVFEVFFDIRDSSFKDTIFNRPPLLFSLAILIDKLEIYDPTKIEEGMLKVDAIVDDANQVDKSVSIFRDAIKSSTQRIRSRRIRNDFLKNIIDA